MMDALRGVEGWTTAPRRPFADIRTAATSLRDNHIANAGGRCEACAFEMVDATLLHLHHVVLVSRGGTNDAANPALLCPNCHARAHWIDRTVAENDRPRDRDALIVLLRLA